MSNTLRLNGHHALVTGAARGIGAEIARRLAADGAALTLLGRKREALHELADARPGTGHGIALADVTDAQAVAAAFAQARSARGPVAILVNNAGQAESAPFLETSLELWQRMLAVNLTGSFVCVQPAEVADAVAWLCGDDAAAITGQSISVSGGEIM